jgi:hypothetical protein
MREAFSVVHILIPGETTKYGLAEQTGQQMAGVLASAALRQRRTSQFGEAERVVEFPVGQKARVGGDAAAVEFQFEAAVKIGSDSMLVQVAGASDGSPLILLLEFRS